MIAVYTVDGTGSPGATYTAEQQAQMGKGGGFPASIGYGLQLALPKAYVWRPVEYYPGLQPGYSLPVKLSMARAMNYIIGSVQQSPDEQVLLAGHRQGAWVVDLIVSEFTQPQGALYAYRNNLIGVYTSGDPRRAHGHTIPGGTDPGGGGAVDFNCHVSWGDIAAPESGGPDWWSFCQPGDFAADCPLSGAGAEAIRAGFNFFYDVEPTTTVGFVTQFIQFVGQRVFGSPDERQEARDAWNMVMVFFGQGQAGNPHAHYGNGYPYLSLPGNSKSAVELAIEHWTQVGEDYLSSNWVPQPGEQTHPDVAVSWWPTPPTLT